MPPVSPPFLTFTIEFIYSIFAIIMCMMIYLKTRSMYQLTGHKGLKYFSLTFLFFSVGYFFRFTFHILIRLFLMNAGIRLPMRVIFNFGRPIFAIASLLSVSYLLYSLLYKHLKKDISVWIWLSVLAVTGISWLAQNPFIHVIFSAVIYLAVFVVLLKKKKKHSKLHHAYLAIIVLWIINTIVLEVPRFMLFETAALYLASLALYAAILHRVMKAG